MKTSNKILLTTYLLGFVVAAIFLMAAKSNMIIPEAVEESGNMTTVEKSIASFSNLKIGNDIQVEIVPSTTPFMRVESDANFHEYLEIHEEDNYLAIEVSRAVRFNPSRPFHIQLGISELKELNIHGNSVVQSDSSLTTDFLNLHLYGASKIDVPLQTGQVNLEVNGASNAFLHGTTNFLEANLSGASNLEAQNLVAEIVHVQASGASNANVQALDFLKAHASGASNVRYVGTPKQLNDSYNGAASVQPIN